VKILIVHLGTLSQLIPATSIIKGLSKKSKCDITWVVEAEEYKDLFKYNKSVKRVITFSELKKMKGIFDVLINLHPKFPHKGCRDIEIKASFDYSFENEFKNFVDIIYHEKISNINIFQIYYKLAGLKWKGEGYNIQYYPRTRSKNKRVGVAVANANLRHYITNKLDLKDKRIWHIPYKKNIFKKMDEINRCKEVVTDDMTTFHLSMAMKKYVYFLRSFPSNIKMEFFGSGQIFDVPLNIIQ